MPAQGNLLGWKINRGRVQRRTSLTISPPRECVIKMIERSRYPNLRCKWIEFLDDRVPLTTSFLLSRDNSCTKLIECWNRVFNDAFPFRLTMFASYPQVRTRTCDKASSFDSRSWGQHMLSLVQVSLRWPRKPWTKTILYSEVNEVHRQAEWGVRNLLGCYRIDTLN